MRPLVPIWFVAEPTAVQIRAETQETASSESIRYGEPSMGLGVTRHVPRLKVSTSGPWNALLPL